MRFLIPIIAALLYRAGGADQWKWCPLNQHWWRWLMGVAIGLCEWHGWLNYGFTIGAYFIATNAFPYGEKSWLNFLGEYGKFAVAGLAVGLCSFVLLPLWLAVLQSLLSALSFVLLHYLDKKDVIKNPWQELLRGFMGTILFITKGG